MIQTIACAAAASVAGTLVAGILACLPGVHAYNLLALFFLGAHSLAGAGYAVPDTAVIAFTAGMLVGWSVLSAVPSVLLAAPDDSTALMVTPGQSYLMRGRGCEAVMLIAQGALGGVLLVVLVMAPLAPGLVPPVWEVFRPHAHWIVWVVIAFLLQSEWPKEGNRGPAGWRRFGEALLGPLAGLATFVLSGLLGFILMYRSPIHPAAAFQNLMPAFVGLFAVPGLLLNLLSRTAIPPQDVGAVTRPARVAVLKGVFGGALGGGFAAFFPAVTGGVGALLAGHATAQQDERTFLASQGASKVVYYAGAYLLFFLPEHARTRGGAAWLVQGFCTPAGWHDYGIVVGAIALSGVLAYAVTGPVARTAIRLAERVNFRALSFAALGVVIALTALVTGVPGLAVLATAAGIGLIPLVFHSRRLNCLGVILLPIACNMSGFGPTVAHWLGLL